MATTMVYTPLITRLLWLWACISATRTLSRASSRLRWQGGIPCRRHRGSILGVKFGAQALPNKWTEVLNDRLVSAVRGENHNTLSQLAKRTVAVAETMSATARAPKFDTLSGDASGIWELDTGWGAQLLKLSEGTIYLVDNELGPFNISASSWWMALKFSFAIDKGDWDYRRF